LLDSLLQEIDSDGPREPVCWGLRQVMTRKSRMPHVPDWRGWTRRIGSGVAPDIETIETDELGHYI